MNLRAIRWFNVDVLPVNGHCYAAAACTRQALGEGYGEYCLPIPPDLASLPAFGSCLAGIMPDCGGVVRPMGVWGEMKVPMPDGRDETCRVQGAALLPVGFLDPVSILLHQLSREQPHKISFMGLPLQAISEFPGQLLNGLVPDLSMESLPLMRFGPAGQQRFYRARLGRHPPSELRDALVRCYASHIASAAGRNEKVLALVQSALVRDVVRALSILPGPDAHEMPDAQPSYDQVRAQVLPCRLHPALLRNLGALEPVPYFIKRLVDAHMKGQHDCTVYRLLDDLLEASASRLPVVLPPQKFILARNVLKKLVDAEGGIEGRFEDVVDAVQLAGGNAWRSALMEVALEFHEQYRKGCAPSGELTADFKTGRRFLHLEGQVYLLATGLVAASGTRPGLYFWRLRNAGGKAASWYTTDESGHRINAHGEAGSDDRPRPPPDVKVDFSLLAQRIKNEWILLHRIYQDCCRAGYCRVKSGAAKSRRCESAKSFVGGRLHIRKTMKSMMRKDPKPLWQVRRAGSAAREVDFKDFPESSLLIVNALNSHSRISEGYWDDRPAGGKRLVSGQIWFQCDSDRSFTGGLERRVAFIVRHWKKEMPFEFPRERNLAMCDYIYATGKAFTTPIWNQPAFTSCFRGIDLALAAAAFYSAPPSRAPYVLVINNTGRALPFSPEVLQYVQRQDKKLIQLLPEDLPYDSRVLLARFEYDTEVRVRDNYIEPVDKVPGMRPIYGIDDQFMET